MNTEKLRLINGNKRDYIMPLPRIYIMSKYINDTALERIRNNTGLTFKSSGLIGYMVIPRESKQIAALLLTYNFKTRYYNNANYKNTLFLKFDNHTGFDVDSICYECCKKNNINTNGLKPGDRLAC